MRYKFLPLLDARKPILIFKFQNTGFLRQKLGCFKNRTIFLSKIIRFPTQLKQIGISQKFPQIDKVFFEIQSLFFRDQKMRCYF